MFPPLSFLEVVLPYPAPALGYQCFWDQVPCPQHQDPSRLSLKVTC